MADISPTVDILAPVILPAALIAVAALKLEPLTLPAVETCPLVRKFPACTLAVTSKLPSVPTVVKLLVTTLLLKTVPVSKEAAGEETTPVSCDPLPIKKLPAVMLPVAEIAEFPISVPVTVMPPAVTATTLAVPVAPISMDPL